MFRGRFTLESQSVRYYTPLIEAIAACPDEVWHTDAHAYGGDVSELLVDTADQLRAVLLGASDTFVTKIMLGVVGCIPAFDRYFKKGFDVATFGIPSLEKLRDFYESNAEVIEQLRTPTLDFATASQQLSGTHGLRSSTWRASSRVVTRHKEPGACARPSSLDHVQHHALRLRKGRAASTQRRS